MISELKLVLLSKDDETNYYEMLDDFLSHGEHIDLFGIGYENRDFEMLLKRLKENELGVKFKEGFAPNSTYYLRINNGKLLGLFNLRHSLSPELLIDGGHIGYAVRPSERGKGLSHEILRQGLGVALEMGLSKVMLSVDLMNKPSISVIEKQNGILEEEKMIQGKLSRNYWIYLTDS